MATWVTSDLHFGHVNILKFEQAARARFKDVDHMDEMMIKEWNELVDYDDEVFILGDVSFRNPERTAEILCRIRGNLRLIPGNHDQKLLKHELFREQFYDILPPIYEHSWNGQKIVMCHYPIAEWNGCHRGTLHFYGHLHSSKVGGEFDELRTLNVGMDPRGRIATGMEEACRLASSGRIKGHHAK